MIRLIFWSDSILDKLLIIFQQVINFHRSAIKQVKCKSKKNFSGFNRFSVFHRLYRGASSGSMVFEKQWWINWIMGRTPCPLCLGLSVGQCRTRTILHPRDSTQGMEYDSQSLRFRLSKYLHLIFILALNSRVLFFQEKRAPLSFTLSKTVDYVSPWHLLKFTAVKNLSNHQNNVLNKLGLIYFLYLFLYSGLEFTITFLTHHTFEYTAMQQGKMFLVIGEFCFCHSS